MSQQIVKPVNPVTFVIFGASGDLTKRKLIPALYDQYRKGRLPEELRIVGFARRPYNDDEFRNLMRDGVKEFLPNVYGDDVWARFASKLSYTIGHLETESDFNTLKQALDAIDQGKQDRLYYLATSPEYYETIITLIGKTGLAQLGNKGHSIIIEKPFGRDLQSAHKLNDVLHAVFDEQQIYRIDHYLGKETAQNVLFLRFANTIFEPIWNRRYIDNIQITVAETVDVGHRAGYYDSSGILRDMFQNHLLQLLTLIAMEPPASFNADALRNEKVKVLSAIRPISCDHTIRGQYKGYRETPGVAQNSETATYGALALYIDNWRWQGVPFYIRSGKALKEKVSEVEIQFMAPPHLMFHQPEGYQMTPNALSLCIQPDEGVHLSIETKVPDSSQQTRSVDLEFHYRSSFKDAPLPDAYQRLLIDAIRHDASLFARSDEIEAAWKLIDPVIVDWASDTCPELFLYEQGSWGPEAADKLLEASGKQWRLGCGNHDKQ